MNSEEDLTDEDLEENIDVQTKKSRKKPLRFFRDKQPKNFNKKPLENLNLREILRDMIDKN